MVVVGGSSEYQTTDIGIDIGRTQHRPLTGWCSSPFASLEPAVSCRHSSVTWAVGHTSHTSVTFPADKLVSNHTAW